MQNSLKGAASAVMVGIRDVSADMVGIRDVSAVMVGIRDGFDLKWLQYKRAL